MDTTYQLEKLTALDFPYYFQLVNDGHVMAMITERPIGLAEAQKDYQMLLENNKLHNDFGSYKIIDTKTGSFIGLAKLEIRSPESKEAEIGYMLLPEHWGKGIASCIGHALVEKARKQASLERLMAIIDPNNLASRKILTNNGFTSRELKAFDGLPGEILHLELV